jgi:hypothetical protein
MKIRPEEAELFHADRRTDGRTEMTKLIFATIKFCERAQNFYGTIADNTPMLYSYTAYMYFIRNFKFFTHHIRGRAPSNNAHNLYDDVAYYNFEWFHITLGFVFVHT